MGKKKEWYMDYATHAFVIFASLGCPTREEFENRIRQDCYNRLALHEPSFIVMKANAEVSSRKPLLEDIDAVNRVLDILKKQDKQHIAHAIRDVYFVAPYGKPEHGVIVERVTAYAMKCPASTKAVYAWLKSARLLFAQIRGLDTGGNNEKW
jgi:hypothetical protein